MFIGMLTFVFDGNLQYIVYAPQKKRTSVQKLPTTISAPRAKIACKFPGVSQGGGMGNDRTDSCINYIHSKFVIHILNFLLSDKIFSVLKA